MNLYQIREEIETIMNQADENGELPEGAFAQLADLGMAEADKVENLGLMIKNMSAEADAIKIEADNLTKRRGTVENRVESIKTYLTDYLLTYGQKFRTPRLALSLRPSVGVVVEDEQLIPSKYFVAQDPKVSKSAIKEAIESGTSVPGARVETRQNLQVK